MTSTELTLRQGAVNYWPMVAIWASSMLLATAASGSWAADAVPGQQVEQKLVVGDRTVEFLLYLPQDYRPDGEPKPLMLFLHGRGESNGPLSLVAKWGPPRMVARGDQLPYVLVSPQCPREERWEEPGQQALLLKLLEHVIASYRVDTDRVYLTGLSLGGFGSWRLAADHPGRFAAVVPICGKGDPNDAEKLKDVPIWAFHGTIRAAGGTKIRFTSLEHVGHNCWSGAYATPDLYQWLAQQRLSLR